MANQPTSTLEMLIPVPPRGLAILALLGPSLVWCAEYIGSGEVVLAPRTGAILGPGAMWVIVTAILLKCWIGLGGARYTVCTGEGMIDLFSRIPGPRNWVVWIVLVVQLVAAMLSIGALANAAGFFVGSLLHLPPAICAWGVALLALAVAWTGEFYLLKIIMSTLVMTIILGVLYIASRVMPGWGELVAGMSFQMPPVPDWAIQQSVSANPWREVIPLMGWTVGGFASQVWYSYWVIGANYGATAGRGYGQAADVAKLQRLDRPAADRLKGWCRVVYADAAVAVAVGLVVTGGFLIAGAGVLRPRQKVPGESEMAEVLADILGAEWGTIGRTVYLLAGAAALISTQMGQLAGWPRLLADCFRICMPAFARRLSWTWQYRSFLLLFFFTNMLVIYGLGQKPERLIQLAAALDGVLLTALQAACVGVGLFYVLPRLLSAEAWQVLRPSPLFAVGLAAGTLVFGYLCIVRIPAVIAGFFY